MTPTRTGVCIAAVVAAGLLAGVRPVAGQVVHGRVLARAAAETVPGAVVLLLDSSATVVHARALTGEHGEYALTAPAPGLYRLRALRIGFRPTTTPVMAARGDTDVTVIMADIAVELPAVTTSEQNQCTVRPDSSLATFTLWEEAKTALLAAAITRDDEALRFDAVQHTRLWDLGSGALSEMGMRETTIEGTRSWTSRPPEDLRRQGYVTKEPTRVTYVAPDLDVLLSPYFADAHCFRVHAGVNAAGAGAVAGALVGLDFEPAGSPHHVEIRGTLWMDRSSRELRSLAFYYFNLGYRGIDTLAGGVAEFARLRTGAWVLTDWSIRMPVPPEFMNRSVATFGRIVMTSAGPRWGTDKVRVTGGTVREIRRDSTVLWSRATGAIAVTVVAPDGGGVAPVRHAMVLVPGDTEAVFTDAGGHATLSRLVPGSYLVEVTTAELELLARPRARARVEVGSNGDAKATIVLESALAAARSVCGALDEPITDSTGAVVGIVTRDNAPFVDAPVTLSFDEGRRNPGEHLLSRNTRTMASDGRFLICGVPRDRALEVHVWNGEESMVATVRLGRDQVAAPLAIAFAAKQGRQRAQLAAGTSPPPRSPD